MAKIYQEGEESGKEPSARLRLVSFVPLLSIFIKENESSLYLFVSKIATSLSGNSSSEWTLFPVTKWQLRWGANRSFVSLFVVCFINLQTELEVKPASLRTTFAMQMQSRSMLLQSISGFCL